MPFCQICKFQVIDTSVSNCPNCGAPLGNEEKDSESIEKMSLDTGSFHETGAGLSENGSYHELPSGNTGDDDLEICNPGDMLYADQQERESAAENASSETPKPALSDRNIDNNSMDSPPSTPPGGIQKLSDEQVNSIRSNLLKQDSEYISAEDASSIVHEMVKSTDGPTLQRNTPASNSSANHNSSKSDSIEPSAQDNAPFPVQQSVAAATHKSAPIRKVAYFHKNFIQLTGQIRPSSGEELVIEDRHYLLKPKKIKPQYTIGVFAVLVVILLFIAGKQFISPTMPGQGAVIGIILDDTGRPILTGIELSIPKAGKDISSDAIGFFRFDEIPTGVYEIHYSLPDGRSGVENISVADNQITTLTVNTADAQDPHPVNTASSTSPSRPRADAGRQTAPQSMPPVPEEKKQEAETAAKSQKQFSNLKLSANVDDAKLIVNGEVLGRGNMTYKKLSPGSHKAKVTKDGYKAWSGTINLPADETYTLKVTLEEISNASTETSYTADDFYKSGKTMLADGNLDAAVQDLTEAITMQPSLADAYYERGKAYEMQRKSILAEENYVRAGEIFSTQKRTEAALDAFNRALAINDKSIPALLNRGDIYRSLDDKNKAMDDFQTVVRHDEENYRANFELGKLYFSSGNYRDADKRLRKARDINPNVPDVYHYLMLNYFARDDFGKVKKVYGQFKSSVDEKDVQAFKANNRFDAILRIVGEYERP